MIIKYKNLIRISEDITFHNYLDIQKTINMTFYNKINNKIKVGIYGHCIKNGGRARITALLINYLSPIKIFDIHLFTRKIEDDEYKIPQNIKRIIINNDLVKLVIKNNIDVLIYQLDYINEIEALNKMNNIKVIFYHHSSTFDWLYENFTFFKIIYDYFTQSKYIISIVPYESDYLFEKWGINSILMNNFITYDYKNVIQSDLSLKVIIMIGRANAKKKRFIIGILAMEYIIKEIANCEMKIVSNLTGINDQINLVDILNLDTNIKFVGYNSITEIFLKNVSLNIFPSISEAFPMVLCETKIYGIPNILLGLNYVAISNDGTIIIYDDLAESLAKEVIKILKNDNYKKNLAYTARKSMQKYNNNLLLKKWIKLILSIYNNKEIDIDYYQILRKENMKLKKNDSINILYKQVNLLRMRDFRFKNLTLYNFENYTFLQSIY
jgi:hypothetical protein